MKPTAAAAPGSAPRAKASGSAAAAARPCRREALREPTGHTRSSGRLGKSRSRVPSSAAALLSVEE